MFVVGSVGDVDADFVQFGRPAEILPPVVEFLYRCVLGKAFEQDGGGVRHAVGLAEGNVVALLELRNGLFAHVFVQAAADEVVEHAVAQGGIGYGHGLHTQFFKHSQHHSQTAGEYFQPVCLQSGKFGLFHAAGFADALHQFFHAGVADGFFGVAGFGRQYVADGFCRAGSTDGEIPTGILICFGDALYFGAGGGDGRLKDFFVDFVLEKTHAVGYAAQRQAFGTHGLDVAADDEFRRTAADVHHQHFVAVRRQGMHHAGVNQACLFASGDDFDGEAQCGFGLRDEFGNVFCHAEGVGGDGAHLFCGKAAQAFAEFGQAGEGALARGFVEIFFVVQSGGKAHHFFNRIDNL